MAKFKVVSGKHHQRQADGSEKTFNQGDSIEMSATEAARFPNKFVPVVEDEPEAVEPEREVAEPNLVVKSAKPAAAQAQAHKPAPSK
jgi:hypothetical protein